MHKTEHYLRCEVCSVKDDCSNGLIKTCPTNLRTAEYINAEPQTEKVKTANETTVGELQKEYNEWRKSQIESQTTQELIREIEKHGASFVKNMVKYNATIPIRIIEVDESWWQQFRKDKGVK